MDEQGGFDSAATSGFITVQAIRLRRYGLGLTERGQAGRSIARPLTPSASKSATFAKIAFSTLRPDLACK